MSKENQYVRMISTERRKGRNFIPHLTEYDKLVEDVRKLSLDQIKEYTENEIPKILKSVGGNSDTNGELVNFCSKFDITENEFRKRIKKKSKSDANVQLFKNKYSESIKTRLNIAHDLTYVIAFCEDRLPPNSYMNWMEGEKAQEVFIYNKIEGCFNLLRKNRDLFGIETTIIYNGIVDRVEGSRAKKEGKRVHNFDLPRFNNPL